MNFIKKLFIILESIILIFASFSIVYWIGISASEYLLTLEHFASWALAIKVILICVLVPIVVMFTFWDLGEAKRKWKDI